MAHIRIALSPTTCTELDTYKDRKAVAADLKRIYSATTESEAEQHLLSFAQTWDKQYPTISKSWMSYTESHYSFVCVSL